MSVSQNGGKPRNAAQPIGLGLYGCGNVGGGFVQVLRAREQDVSATPAALELLHVVVRDIAKPRSAPLDARVLTRELAVPLENERVQIVIEAMGGLQPAQSVVEQALTSGRNVVTANKGLMALRGEKLETLAAENGVHLRYEAAVGGAIPVLHALRGALAGNRIRRVRGIVNGTTNYILTRMIEDYQPYDDALAQAQRLGFAEADPLADVSGADAAQKLVILSRNAFGFWPDLADVTTEGIQGVTMTDLEAARSRGCTLKLVAHAELVSGSLRMSVKPTFVAAEDPLFGVRNEMNAIVVEGDFSGPLLFSGAGAGGRPTGSAVFGDIAYIAGVLNAATADASRERPELLPLQ